MRVAVALPRPHVLAAQVERLARVLPREHLHRPRLELAERWARLWCRLRTSATWSAIFASVGSRWLISIRGTWVRIGRSGPRISAGASGFRSKVSRWLGPPLAQKRTTEKSLLSDGCDFS